MSKVTGKAPGMIDPLLQGTVSAVQRVIGLVAHGAASRIQNARVGRRLKGATATDLDLNWLRGQSYSDLLETFLLSSEFEQVCLVATRAILVDGGTKKGSSNLALAKAVLETSLLRFGVPNTDEILGALWQRLVKSVSSELNRAQAAGGLHPSVRAEIVKTSASIAAAATRNIELSADAARKLEYDAFERALADQVTQVHAKMKLPHVNSARQVTYDELFVQPALVEGDSKTGRRWSEGNDPSLEEILRGRTRIVVLGDPGGGKSTLSVKLAHDVASGVGPTRARAAIFVVLKDFADATQGKDRATLAEYMGALCKSPYETPPPEGALEYLLLNNRLVVILDGLDELLDVSVRSDVVTAVEGFAHKYPTTTIVVTSRRVGYPDAALDPDLFTTYGLHEFSSTQVEQYSERWFALDDSLTTQEQFALQQAFIVDSEFVSDLRVNPLMLSLMCGIYATEKYIPRNRPEVYDKCSMMLFDRWDRQRGIDGGLPFDAHVQSAMRSLALHMYETRGASTTLSRSKLVATMTKYLLGRRFALEEDAESAAVQFVDFCKGRAWVLTEMGVDEYGFTHRTFLEYFAASQLVRQSKVPEVLIERLAPSIEANSATVVNQLALQILGKNVEDGADDFIGLAISRATADGLDRIKRRAWYDFLIGALAFIVPRPALIEALMEAIVAEIDAEDARLVDALRPGTIVAFIQSAAFENVPEILRVLRASIDKALLNKPRNPVRLMSILTVHPAGDFFGDDARGAEVWRRWGIENTRDHIATLTKFEKKSPWIPLLLADLGHIKVAEAIRLCGAAPLFSMSRYEGPQRAPFAYRYLITGNLDEGLVVKPTKVPKKKDFVEELSDALIGLERPWFASSESDVPIVRLISHRRARKPLPADDLAVLLTLPALEQAAIVDAVHFSSDRERVRMVQWKHAWIELDRVSEPYRQLLSAYANRKAADGELPPSSSAQVAKFLKSWVAHKADVTKRRSNVSPERAIAVRARRVDPTR